MLHRNTHAAELRRAGLPPGLPPPRWRDLAAGLLLLALAAALATLATLATIRTTLPGGTMPSFSLTLTHDEGLALAYVLAHLGRRDLGHRDLSLSAPDETPEAASALLALRTALAATGYMVVSD